MPPLSFPRQPFPPGPLSPTPSTSHATQVSGHNGTHRQYLLHSKLINLKCIRSLTHTCIHTLV
ncbi:hypothetical protein BGX38DRAFT_1216933 [Terfezia claveryi]|nr:hypothetical protein BGX38DRAFT_1216933 [Terfezia claveryi]